jgi:hypothetical protein
MAKSPISSSANIGLCEGNTSPCVVLMSSTRKDNPSEGCEPVGLKTSVKAARIVARHRHDRREEQRHEGRQRLHPDQPPRRAQRRSDAEGYTMLSWASPPSSRVRR